MTDIDQALLAFEEYKKEYNSFSQTQLSESDTRSKLIDKLLINVLGWSEENITREGKVESGFFDYKLSLPGIHILLEAKKQVIEMVFPENHLRTTLNALLKQNKEVIEQLKDYCIDSGIPLGIITNGHQFIISKFFNSDGTDWKKNQTFIFRSLDDIENRFIDFYNNLSKKGIIANGGFKFLLPASLKKGKQFYQPYPIKIKNLSEIQ